MPQANVKTDPSFPVPDTMKAWVLGDPGELSLTDKPVPVPKSAEVLVRIDGVAICATDPSAPRSTRSGMCTPGTRSAILSTPFGLSRELSGIRSSLGTGVGLPER